MRCRTCRAFTLVELMVVISIIGLLVAIVVPVFSVVIRVAYQIQCAGNLHNLGVAFKSHDASQDLGQGSPLEVQIWRVQIMPYVSDSREVLVCPEGSNVGGTAQTAEKKVSAYALRTYNGTTFLYDMMMADGPCCRKENVADHGKSFDLSFEDQRTSTGSEASFSDHSFANPIMSVQVVGTDVKITVKGGGGGYHWYLVDPKGKVLMPDILKTGPGVGGFITIPGIAGAGRFSYGVNTMLTQLREGTRRIVALDYPNDLVPVAADETRDNWLTWLKPDGTYSFARHTGQCNVLTMDGRVVRMSPEEIDPGRSILLEKYWRP